MLENIFGLFVKSKSAAIFPVDEEHMLCDIIRLNMNIHQHRTGSLLSPMNIADYLQILYLASHCSLHINLNKRNIRKN